MESGSFLGKGFAFPVSVDPACGRFRTAEYEEDIQQAIYMILMTRRGERVMRPDFGCGGADPVGAQDPRYRGEGGAGSGGWAVKDLPVLCGAGHQQSL